MKNVFQATPYTCALACFESLAHDIGISVTQTDILSHHRDICFTQPPEHFGAIDHTRLIHLSSRYLLKCDELNNPTEQQLTDILSRPFEGVLLCCHRFNDKDNSNHCVRLNSIVNDTLSFLDPAFPFARITNASLAAIVATWVPHFMHIQP